ncbi:MAG: hypothetical protein USCAAHI_02415 [Beijerinckiaceae bacterium]|nr:MAG: hypothetical protein USCAAHI_02415 [Beijerinckiaceae bacterium]
MRRLFRVKRDLTGNLPGLPAVHPDTMAPVVRVARDAEREIVMMRWGFPPPPNLGTAPVTNKMARTIDVVIIDGALHGINMAALCGPTGPFCRRSHVPLVAASISISMVVSLSSTNPRRSSMISPGRRTSIRVKRKGSGLMHLKKPRRKAGFIVLG